MINLRQLFRKYNVAFRDSGANCSRGNIAIRCVLCGNSDKSQHLAINESTGQWWCFRNPRHHGPDVSFVLHKLHIPAREYPDLKLVEEAPSIYEDTRDYSAWNYFQPAEENQEVLDYLDTRLFSDPIAVCRQFNLKVSKEGRWCGRLLIPLYPVGWTGRAMRSHLSKRYDAWTNEGAFFFSKQKSSSCILLEGSLDCMRIASVTNKFDVIGKCRMALSPAILIHLRETNYASIYHSPDASVSLGIASAERMMIRSYCPTADVVSLLPPNGNKDFGATTESETRELINTLGSERMVM